ncbi:NYN domain-containing protein [Longimicrobium sp.]|uniref:NYN domain-containing protein n=1 Tax=Longimicrobium sp. TaxID=2029185 RepID=UPI002C4DA935|nr:NYN domain-containing protein [Longimicrobium sp.]HSU14558.1 NYN domain-containing protein [Longimicrobium sp.]
MTTFVPRSPHLLGGAPATPAARNAALLIDFDNITLGVRSDLGKELKTLLNSEIFSGKVAVRRAYADWRRYPNYVVPLTEASIDLIFAPAYGTSKKNATDLRMAVDAIELAFMRPEIGTFILLTGDSDFSSCVLKLKEYGKYVIGVGMRDSSSDLLIQNCDEYYSYHALSGLVREGDQGTPRRDPWLLVREAAQKMAASGDSMRTDRLKQVMIDLDPNFDEKDEGYSKFSKFAQVAAEKGLIRLHKVENGQYEVAPVDDLDAAGPATQPRYDREERFRDRDRGPDRDRGRGRGGRGRDRDRDRPRDFGRDRDREFDREREPRAEPAPVRLLRDDEEPAVAASAAPAAETESETIAAAFPVGEAQVATPFIEEPPAPATREERDALSHAYALLQHAVRALVSRQGQTARDGDVKRRMMEMDGGFDEHALGFSKFSRFLRQAHEDQVVDVRRLAEGRYEVALPSSGTKLAPPALTGPRPEPITVDRDEPRVAADSSATAEPAEPRGRDRGRGRGRGRDRGPREGAPPILPGQVPGGEEERPAAAAQPAPEAGQPETRREEPRREEPRREEPRREEPRREEPRREERPAAESAPPSSASREGPADAQRGLRHRHGGRRPAWASPSGPPPLLPGQVVHVPGSARPEQPAEPQPKPRAEEPAAPQPAAEAPFSAEALGLPTDRAGVEAHLAGYRGVGAATVRSLAEAFGGRVFETLENDPDAVRALLGRRAGPILDQWTADRDARRAERAQAAPAAEEPAPQPTAEEPAEDARDFAEAASAIAPEPVQGETAEGDEADADAVAGETAEEAARRRSRRGRRGGRNRNRNRAAGDGDAAGTTEAPAAEEAPAAAAADEFAPGGEVAAADDAIAAEQEDSDPTLASQAARPGGRSRGRRGRGRGGAPTDAPAAETVDVGGIDVPVGPQGETDPTLMEPASLPAGDAQPRGRSRGRGGRGRGGAQAPAPAPQAEAPAPAPEQPAAGGGRRGRGRGGAQQQATETALPAAPAAEAGGGGRGRAGRGPRAEAAPAAPAAEAPAAGGRRGRGRGGAQPAPEAAPQPAPEAAAGGRGRGRGGNRPAAEAPQPEPPAQGGEGGKAGGSRPRRGRGRGGRGGTPPTS